MSASCHHFVKKNTLLWLTLAIYDYIFFKTNVNLVSFKCKEIKLHSCNCIVWYNLNPVCSTCTSHSRLIYNHILSAVDNFEQLESSLSRRSAICYQTTAIPNQQGSRLLVDTLLSVPTYSQPGKLLVLYVGEELLLSEGCFHKTAVFWQICQAWLHLQL